MSCEDFSMIGVSDDEGETSNNPWKHPDGWEETIIKPRSKDFNSVAKKLGKMNP